MAVYLVCEGKLDGLDRRVLDALVIQPHSLSVRIEPTGGSKGLGLVRNYLESRIRGDVAIAVEDRDFRSQAHAHGSWTKVGARHFHWRRHEIENYLLHPPVVRAMFAEFRTAGYTWANSLPSTDDDVTLLLQSFAKELLEDHAANLFKEEMVERINQVPNGGLSFGPSRPASQPGVHAPGQAEWLQAFEQEALRLARKCGGVAGLSDLQPAEIATRYGFHLAQCQNPTFLTSGEFLLEMGGSELLAALARHLHSLHAPSSLNNQGALADELLRVLGRMYHPNTLFHPDDFADLAQALRNHLPTP